MGRLRTWYGIAVAATLLEVALAILSMQRIGTLRRVFLAVIANPTERGVAAVDRAGQAVDVLALPTIGVAVLGLIAIIGWLHSGAKRVSDGDLGVLRYSTGWAIGGWFVPILNLVRVPQIAADVYRAARSAPRAGLVIGVWWALWVLDSITARIALAQPAPQTPDAMVSALDLITASYWLNLASGAATIAMMTLVTTGLGRASARPRAPLAPAGPPAASLWGPPPGLPDARFGTPVPDARFGAPAPDPRFGTPAPVPAAAPPSGPPMSLAPPVTAPVAAPAAPPPPALAPAAPAAAPPAPAPAPSDGAAAPSPYPPTQTFFPE